MNSIARVADSGMNYYRFTQQKPRKDSKNESKENEFSQELKKALKDTELLLDEEA